MGLREVKERYEDNQFSIRSLYHNNKIPTVGIGKKAAKHIDVREQERVIVVERDGKYGPYLEIIPVNQKGERDG